MQIRSTNSSASLCVQPLLYIVWQSDEIPRFRQTGNRFCNDIPVNICNATVWRAARISSDICRRNEYLRSVCDTVVVFIIAPDSVDGNIFVFKSNAFRHTSCAIILTSSVNGIDLFETPTEEDNSSPIISWRMNWQCFRFKSNLIALHVRISIYWLCTIAAIDIIGQCQFFKYIRRAIFVLIIAPNCIQSSICISDSHLSAWFIKNGVWQIITFFIKGVILRLAPANKNDWKFFFCICIDYWIMNWQEFARWHFPCFLTIFTNRPDVIFTSFEPGYSCYTFFSEIAQILSAIGVIVQFIGFSSKRPATSKFYVVSWHGEAAIFYFNVLSFQPLNVQVPGTPSLWFLLSLNLLQH